LIGETESRRKRNPHKTPPNGGSIADRRRHP
jgi:hypothetical protein